MGRNTLSGCAEVTAEHVDIREQKSICCVCPVVSVCVSMSDGTVSAQQGLCSEKWCLQHVCRLHDQHVFQPAEVLRPQTFIRLRGITWKRRSKSGKTQIDGWMRKDVLEQIWRLCVTKLGLVIRTGDTSLTTDSPLSIDLCQNHRVYKTTTRQCVGMFC